MDNPIILLSDSIQNKQSAVLATVVAVVGASPAKTGAQMVLLADGSTAGTVGGGKLEVAIIADAQAALSDGQPRLKHYTLTEEGKDAIGVLCGGEVRVFIQPFLAPPELVIVGGGHIGCPLKVMGEAAGFDVVVVDVEPGRADVPALAEVALVDQAHLEERRRFFTVWLARTLGLDTSEEFSRYLFRAGQFHAGHGPRHIHTPDDFVTVSIGLVLSTFASYLVEAGLPGEVIGTAMSGWSKYLTVQLNQTLMGYQTARESERGELAIRVNVFGRLRPILGGKEFTVHIDQESCVSHLLQKFFEYFPQARDEALERSWSSEEESDSLWVEVIPNYKPLPGWRFLLNGRDLYYDGGFEKPLKKEDEIAIFPPGR